MKNLTTKIASFTLLVAFLAACQSTPIETDTPKPTTPSNTTTTPDSSGTSGTGMGGTTGKPVDANAELKQGILAKRSVYFDYDSNVVKEDYRAMLQAHAKFLVANPTRTIRIEGNTDERGSREYNLALGSRRGDAVKKLLNVLGVPETRIEVISFGEEKPKGTGSDEAAFAENRRADISYNGE